MQTQENCKMREEVREKISYSLKGRELSKKHKYNIGRGLRKMFKERKLVA